MVAHLGVVSLVEGIVFAAADSFLGYPGGNPRFGIPGSDVGDTFSVVLPVEGSVF
jgi:hypothetical protein